MRRRLLASTLSIAIATVALFGIPLAFVLDRVVHNDAQDRLQRDAVRVARELGAGTTIQEPIAQLVAQFPRLVPADDSVVVQFPNGNRAAMPIVRPAISATAPGPEGTVVTLFSPAADVDGRVRRALLILIGLALAGIGAALVLALVQSSRLSEPLARLSRSATRLGEGDFSLQTPRSGIPEIDGIAVALDSSASRVAQLLQAERDFSTNASHQLRSALTGLELRLDELAHHPDPAVQAEASAALEQAERLTTTVEELLALARTGRAGIVGEFDLADLVRKHAADAADVLDHAGRSLVVDAGRPARVVAAVGALGQVLDIVLANAIRHGRGAVTVRVQSDERHVAVEISDQGAGLDPEDPAAAFRERPDADGHGIGLALARALMTAEGGTITVTQPRPPTFRIELPRA